MRFLALSILLLVSSGSIGFGQQDPDAEPYLDKIASDLDPGYTIQIEFDYTREDLQDKTTIDGEGTLYLFGDKYKLEMEEFIIYFDGEKQYSLNLDIEEVYVSIPDPDDKEFMFSDPITLLRNYKNEFKYMYKGTSSIEGINASKIQLNPIELDGPYAILNLYVSSTKKLKGIQVRHKEGILYTMIVNSFMKIDQASDSFFQFSDTEYPNVDVIELMN